MNLDKNRFFANQVIDNDPTECVALTVADIAGNITGQLYDPDMVYANALKIMNETPNVLGLDPKAGMQSAVVYGLLPVTEETFNAKTTSQLYIANWQNYPPAQRASAQQHVMRGVVPLYTYQDICSYLNRCKAGVSLTVKWHENFNTPNGDGTLPDPEGPFTYHCIAVYDNPLKGLMFKPHLGPLYGDSGYGYMSQTVFNEVFAETYGFDLNAWRWLSLVQIALSHPWIIPDVLPLLNA